MKLFSCGEWSNQHLMKSVKQMLSLSLNCFIFLRDIEFTILAFMFSNYLLLHFQKIRWSEECWFEWSEFVSSAGRGGRWPCGRLLRNMFAVQRTAGHLWGEKNFSSLVYDPTLSPLVLSLIKLTSRAYKAISLEKEGFSSKINQHSLLPNLLLQSPTLELDLGLGLSNYERNFPTLCFVKFSHLKCSIKLKHTFERK